MTCGFGPPLWTPESPHTAGWQPEEALKYAYIDLPKPCLNADCYQLPTSLPCPPPTFLLCWQNSLLWIRDKHRCPLRYVKATAVQGLQSIPGSALYHSVKDAPVRGSQPKSANAHPPFSTSARLLPPDSPEGSVLYLFPNDKTWRVYGV